MMMAYRRDIAWNGGRTMAAEPVNSELLLTIGRLQGQVEEQSKLLHGLNNRIDRLYIALGVVGATLGGGMAALLLKQFLPG